MGLHTPYYTYREKPRISLDKIIFVLLCFTLILSVIHLPGAHGYQPRARSFFHRYQDSVVRLYSGGHVIPSTLDSQGSHFHNVTAEFAAFGRQFVLDLSLNRQLVSGAYVQKVFHGTAQHSNSESNDVFHSRIPHLDKDHCFYHGTLRHNSGSSAAISTCDGLRGYVTDRHDSYHIEPVQGNKENIVRVYRSSDQRALPFKCGTEGHDLRLREHQDVLHRHRRSAKVRAPYDSNQKTRYVELYLVSDYRTYQRHGKNASIVIQRSKDIANIVSSLYRQLNIYVILVGVEVWAGGDRVRVTTSADNTMESFLRYRMQRINPVHHNDNAQLITGVFFDHGVVGKAIKGPICTHQFSGGVNMDYGGVVSLVATTVAHEMGHNFGMEHDNDTQCSCLSDKCIMSATSGKISPKSWSSCSHNALAEAFHLGMDYCLRNIPGTVYEGPICGNGLMEEGEECDCGLPQDCTSQCCDPHTCKMYPLAKCATGLCCNLRTCQPKPATSSCRSAANECDLPEFCNGTSEFCPDDVFNQDGRECMSGQSYCYRGRCSTHTDQCKLLWGESGRVSDPICFQQLNMKGNDYGSCGYNWTLNNYKRCNKEDAMCGLLHCVHLNEKLMFWRDNLAIAKRASFLTRGNSQYVCRSAMLDVGLDMPDPGFVGDGVKCEHNKICLNQKCVALGKLKIKQCPQNCLGRGVCNSEGHCHCQNGYAPPLCDKPGYGGSIHSGPVSNKNGPTVTQRPAVTGSTPHLDHDQGPTTNDWNVSVSTNSSGSSGSAILGDDDDILVVALLIIFLVVLPLVALVVLLFCFRARLKPYWHRFMLAFTNWAKCKNRRPKPIPPAKDFDIRGSRVSGGTKGPKPPIYRDKQVSNPLLLHENERDSNKPDAWSAKKPSVRDNAPPIRPPPPPSCPPSVVRSGSKSKKVRLSTPIQETQGPPSSSSSKPSPKGASSTLLSSASEDESSSGPSKLAKRESFRGSQISSPVLVCTTNRDSLVLADRNVDIIGPEALNSKPRGVGQVKRSQSERGELASARPTVKKSASVRASLVEESPPSPLEEEEDDTQPLYSNEGLGMGDLLSEIDSSLFKGEEEQLYNNLPIQETVPPCPPRPEKYRPSSGGGALLKQSVLGTKPTSDGNSSQPSQTSLASKPTASSSQVVNTSSTAKTPTRQSSLNTKPGSRDSTTKTTDSNNKNHVANELRQKILARTNLAAPNEDVVQNSSNPPVSTSHVRNSTTTTSATPSVKSTASRTSSALSSSSPTPTISTSNQTRPSTNPNSVKAGSTNESTRFDGEKSAASIKKADEPSPSVSSLKAKFNQTPGGTASTSNIQKNAPNISGPNRAKGVTDSNTAKSENSSTGLSQPGPKASVHKGLPQKPSAGLKTETTKNQSRSKVAELKASLDKTQATGTAKAPAKPVPQAKPAVKPVPTERSGTAKPAAASGSGSGRQSSGQPARPVIPPKPGEASPSDSADRSLPKPATRTSGAASQPKRVQSFRV